MKDSMCLAPLWREWPNAGPWHAEPLSGGTNNHVWGVETASGERYVLRLFPDLTQLPRLRFETALLRALSQSDLPVQLPTPVPTQSGEYIAFLEQETETVAFAILSPFLLGSHPDRNDVALAAPAAAALAALDNALGTLPAIAATDGYDPNSYGGLVRGYAPVPDPLIAVERLPVERTQVRQIQNILTAVRETISSLYSRLPQQLLHRDYAPSNVLMDGREVTAILDFEFAGGDLRVMELCVALSWWPAHLMGTGKEWELLDAFATAYLAAFPLSAEELHAIPAVLRLRDAGSLVHRMGRYLAGLEPDTRMQEQVEDSLWREAWLTTHGELLQQHIKVWAQTHT
jgi:homoserine kinase type II